MHDTPLTHKNPQFSTNAVAEVAVQKALNTNPVGGTTLCNNSTKLRYRSDQKPGTPGGSVDLEYLSPPYHNTFIQKAK